MHYTVNEFLRLKRYQVSFVAPCPGPCDNTDEECLLTLKKIPSIRHAIKGSDNRIYDAFALYDWFHKQDSIVKFVIPGNEIKYVSGYTWYEFVTLKWYNSISQMRQLKIPLTSFLHSFALMTHISKNTTENTPKHTPKHSTVATQTEISNAFRPQRTIRKRKLVPSHYSAFTHIKNA